MRRCRRPAIDRRAHAFLQRKQGQVDGGNDVAKLWKSARRTQTVRTLAKALATATGQRERCMYCQDSRGTDIDHFRPKAHYPAYVFVWPNWLWVCAGCNRAKGDDFPEQEGTPLLIDPSAEDPWQHLIFEPVTGEIAARWQENEEDPKGRATLEVLAPLRHQAVCEGRLRAHRRLMQAVERFLEQAGNETTGARVNQLRASLRDADDYGLLEWVLVREGSHDRPFHLLRDQHPTVWARLHELLFTPDG